jgi:hypothetical protein
LGPQILCLRCHQRVGLRPNGHSPVQRRASFMNFQDRRGNIVRDQATVICICFEHGSAFSICFLKGLCRIRHMVTLGSQEAHVTCSYNMLTLLSIQGAGRPMLNSLTKVGTLNPNGNRPNLGVFCYSSKIT